MLHKAESVRKEGKIKQTEKENTVLRVSRCSQINSK